MIWPRSGTKRKGYSKRERNSKRRDYAKRKRRYLPKITRSTGGNYRPRSYVRAHDFKYDREPPLKPPEVETSYGRSESNSQANYSKLHSLEVNGTHEIERVVNSTLEKYFDEIDKSDTSEKDKVEELPIETAAQTEGNSHMDMNEGTSTYDVTVEAEPLPEAAVNDFSPGIERGPELYESYELPVKDLELLLSELDANALEIRPRPENKVETESASEV